MLIRSYSYHIGTILVKTFFAALTDRVDFPTLLSIQQPPSFHKERRMPTKPTQYQNLLKRFRGVLKAVDGLGKATKAAGPLNRKNAELIQLAAAAAIRSEGSGSGPPCRFRCRRRPPLDLRDGSCG